MRILELKVLVELKFYCKCNFTVKIVYQIYVSEERSLPQYKKSS